MTNVKKLAFQIAERNGLPILSTRTIDGRKEIVLFLYEEASKDVLQTNIYGSDKRIQ